MIMSENVCVSIICWC